MQRFLTHAAAWSLCLFALGCASAPTATPIPASNTCAQCNDGICKMCEPATCPACTTGQPCACCDDAQATVQATLAQGRGYASAAGLSCPQCSNNLDQQLLKVPGVSDVVVDLGTGVVTFAVADNAEISDAKIKAAIQDAGFSVNRVELP